MGLTVYNTLSRKKESFQPVEPGKVGIYLCGPTVYKPSHIGHAVGPIIFDAIKRYLVFRGYEVTWVVNITDVDDKLIEEAQRQGTSTLALAERVTKDYLQAMDRLNVSGIDIMPKASEHIPDIVAFVQRLVDRGFAYASNGDVYFDVTKDDDYGKLSNRKIEDQTGQRDLHSGEKRNPGDFALWKAAKESEPDEVKYDSPWGKGRPGWHIECSAMAMRYLGETFDIHGGGIDLVFPHHENEVAQSESATGKPFANWWMHNGLTRINTKKISKSDASPEMQAALTRMTLHNLLDEYPGELIRFFVLSTQYRRPIEYSPEEIASKRKGLDTFYRLFQRIERICGQSPYTCCGDGFTSTSSPSDAPKPQALSCAKIENDTLATAYTRCFEQFMLSMDDDFNTAGAIAALFDFAGAINRYIEEKNLEKAGTSKATSGDSSAALNAAACLIGIAQLIGVFLEPQKEQAGGADGLADKAMQVLIQVRQHLRGKKDFESADLIRDLLREQKITLEDRAGETEWRAE